MVRNNCLIFFLFISVFLVITTASSSSNNSTKTDEKSQKREDGDSDDDSSSDSSSSDSSSSDSGPSPIHSSFPIGSPFAMFPRMPFSGPMSPFGMYRPYPPMGPAPMAGSPIGSTGTGMAASMMRPVMSPFHGHPAQAQPLFAPMSPLGVTGISPISSMGMPLGASGMPPISSMGISSLGASAMGMAGSFPAMRRAWEPHHQPITGHSLLDQLLHSESHSDPLSEPFGSPLLGSEPIEQMDEEEFYEKLRQHQRERQSQVASRREFRESARDSYRDSRVRRPYQRNQIPPPSTHSYDDRHRDNGYHDNRPDPYEPMQEENRYDRGHHPGDNHRGHTMDREHGGSSNYIGNNQRDPMEYDDRPPADGPPSRAESRPPGPPGEDRPPYVRRSIHDERSPDYGMFDDKKA